jgi:hypothetical protein
MDEGFWYAESTKVIYGTANYKIIDEQLDLMTVTATPINNTLVGKGPPSYKFLGIPITNSDLEVTDIVWKKNMMNINKDGKVQKRDKANEFNSTFYLNVDFDFTQRHYTITYYKFLDLFADIGGLAASFAIIVSLATFFVPLGMLMTLAAYIKQNSRKKAVDEFKQLIKVAQRQFLEIL